MSDFFCSFLGQGEFGEVYQGTAFDILGADTGPHPVAIKVWYYCTCTTLVSERR